MKFKRLVLPIGLFFVLLSIAAMLAVELREELIVDGKASISVPLDFVQMEQDVIDVKYPNANRPDEVFSNAEGSINVALSYTTSRATAQTIKPYQEAMIEPFEKTNPTADWKSTGVKVVNGKNIGYLELVTDAADTQVYNLIFFTDVDGRLLMCSFNCTIDVMDKWTPTAHEIMSSLKVN